MAKLEECGGDVKCSECDMVFTVIWNRNPVYDRVEFCPFCGEEFESPHGE